MAPPRLDPSREQRSEERLERECLGVPCRAPSYFRTRLHWTGLRARLQASLRLRFPTVVKSATPVICSTKQGLKMAWPHRVDEPKKPHLPASRDNGSCKTGLRSRRSNMMSELCSPLAYSVHRQGPEEARLASVIASIAERAEPRSIVARRASWAPRSAHQVAQLSTMAIIPFQKPIRPQPSKGFP